LCLGATGGTLPQEKLAEHLELPPLEALLLVLEVLGEENPLVEKAVSLYKLCHLTTK
jgi:hypothetical protein